MVKLTIIRGPSVGKVITIDKDRLTMGRNQLNDVTLDDDSVSGRHIEISRQDDRYVLHDLKSTNGTLVNGRLVREKVLYTGDEILVGQTTMRYSDGRPPRETDSKAIRLVDGGSAEPTIHATVEAGDESGLLSIPPNLLDRGELVDAHRNLAALYRVSASLNSMMGLGGLFDAIVTQIFRVTTAERACIMLIDESTGNLVEQLVRTRGGNAPDAGIEISHTIVNHVIDSGRGVLTADATSDERFSPGESIVLANIHSALCVPLRIKNDIIGIIYVDNFAKTKPFKRSDLQLLTALGNEAGLAVENTMLYEANIRSERLAAIGQTIAGLSHHIKNILWCMHGGAQIVQREIERENLEGIKKGWDIVYRNESRIGELVMNMLSYSTPRLPHYDPADVNEVVREAVEMAGPIISENDVEVEYELHDAIPPVPLDRSSINRCLLNLLTNAADAAPRPGGRIVASTGLSEDGSHAWIAITDNGKGISEIDMERIFEPFVSTKGGRGTGLGLAVVRKVVEEHQGELKVENSPEGGAEFTMLLPLNPVRSEDPDAPLGLP